MRSTRLIPAALILITCGCTSFDDNLVQFLEHELTVRIDTARQLADVNDQGVMQVQKGWNSFKLNKAAGNIKFAIFPEDLEELTQSENEELLRRETRLRFKHLEAEDFQLATFRSDRSGKVNYRFSTWTEYREDVADISFSNQNVGREVKGTVSGQGAYLSPQAYYYPRGNDELMQFRVIANIPSGWHAVSDGNLTYDNETPDFTIQSWLNPYKVDGLTFMAAPFVVGEAMADSIRVRCYFFEEDTSLFETYLPATTRYIQMYSDMIGSYPYSDFKVTENFFPTGYGFPGWTLLGQEVLRLPFIVMTSLGHEVLHNWWGNSVYVDYDRGNWCEGLTVYGADYLYKERRSPDAARDYRKDILKQYKSYVNAENEFPLRKFTSRSSSYERTIGYNKAMMVFHMIRQEIGDEAFWSSWRDVYAEYIEQEISWEEWIKAFEKRAGVSLAHIVPEWIDRTGAIELSLKVNSSSYDAATDETRIDMTVNQPGDESYTVQVPYRLAGDQVVEDQLRLEAAESNYILTFAGQYSSLELDPDYHLFRHLYPQEIEPILASVYGSTEKHFITYTEEDSVNARFREFGENLTESEIELETGTALVGREGDFAAILLNPDNLPPSLDKWVKIADDQVQVNQEVYSRNNSFVFAVEETEIFAKMLVVISNDFGSLPRLGQKLPHYGKYSYLVFDGTRNIGKGQWPAGDSPLKQSL